MSVQRKATIAKRQREMDQKDLAEAIGIARTSLNRYMQNRQSFPMPVFISIAEAFGLSPKTLMERAEARIRQEG